MSTGEFKKQDMDDRIREYVLKYLNEKELIRHEDNIIYSEKVFIVNAVLRWCLERMQKKKMSADLWAKNRKIIAQYIAGTVNLVWAEDKFEVIEVQNNEDKITRRKGISPNRRKGD
jgi:hypothetical protein